MTLKRFLDCAYALLVEAYQQIGADLLSAIEKVNESLYKVLPETAPEREENIAARNTAELSKLEAMMREVGR